jgi:PAS domain S-box-containing protein
MSKPTYEQLEEEVRTLRERNAEVEFINETLTAGEPVYRALFEHAGLSISIINPRKNKFLIFNKTVYESLGYSKTEFEQFHDGGIIEDRDRTREISESVPFENGTRLFETEHRAKNGDIRHLLVSSVELPINGEVYHLNIASDITQLKNVENDLKEMRNELEERVSDRTKELKNKTLELVESNTALKVIYQKQEEAIHEVEERLLENIKLRVLPHLEKLKKMSPTERQMVSLTELELNLKDILSPFLKRLKSQYHHLTPTEIRIATYIREGKASKEIANLLSVSLNTIEVHRDSLRKKFGIKYKKINLQSYLKTLDTL